MALSRVEVMDLRASGEFYSLVSQHFHQPDQRQADKGIGVIAFEFAEQGDAHAFGLETSGTVERLFMIQIAPDLRLVKLPEMHPEWIATHLRPLVAAVEEAESGIKSDRFAGSLAQLLHRILPVAWFTQNLSVYAGHLV